MPAVDTIVDQISSMTALELSELGDGLHQGGTGGVGSGRIVNGRTAGHNPPTVGTYCLMKSCIEISSLMAGIVRCGRCP